MLDRSYRVVVLVSLIAAMSAVDLYLTILYLTHTGMNELNPLARAMMEYRSPALLGLWKLSTVSLGAGILFFMRKKRCAEIAAILGCVILGALMMHWLNFINEFERLTTDPVLVEAMGDPTFIRFAPAVESVGRTVVP